MSASVRRLPCQAVGGAAPGLNQSVFVEKPKQPATAPHAARVGRGRHGATRPAAALQDAHHLFRHRPELARHDVRPPCQLHPHHTHCISPCTAPTTPHTLCACGGPWGVSCQACSCQITRQTPERHVPSAASTSKARARAYARTWRPWAGSLSQKCAATQSPTSASATVRSAFPQSPLEHTSSTLARSTRAYAPRS